MAIAPPRPGTHQLADTEVQTVIDVRGPGPDAPGGPGGDDLGAAWTRLLTLLAFGALALFAARRWTALLDPAPTGRLTVCAALAVALAVVLTALQRRQLGVRAGRALGAVTAAGILAALLLLAGIADELLKPARWDELATVVGFGLSALLDLRVPYRGDQEAVRVVLTMGGGLLLVLAAVLVAWRGARPLAATIVLGVLYGVPVVLTVQEHPFRDGAAFALLALLLAVAPRVPVRQAPGAAAAGVLALAVALVLAPRLDGDRPLVDYQRLGQTLKPQPTTRYSWDHDYDPLRWPRDGRELLRVRSQTPAYWKGVTLERFDGIRWLRSRLVSPGRGTGADLARSGRADWLARVTVTVRDLRSRELYAPGEIIEIPRSSARIRGGVDGSVVTERRLLTRGDSYSATVYAPRPTRGELREAGTDYPSSVLRSLRVDLPDAAGRPRSAGRRPPGPSGGSSQETAAIVFRPFGSGEDPLSISVGGDLVGDASQALDASAYTRTWALAQRLRAAAASPYDLALRIQRRVRAGATYDEKPPKARVPLESFLFDTRRGYCQQFSGAMALLLRMGGVPARIASGFAPGRRNVTQKDEFVITDLDAHSWVEAYFPGIGWTVFDPTPAAAPPVDQEERDPTVAASADAGDTSRQAPAANAGTAAGRDGGPVPWITVLLALTAAGAPMTGVVLTVRRRRARRAAEDAEGGGRALADLRRALSRTGRPVAPGTTLGTLQDHFADRPGARRYVDAVQRERFAAGRGPDASDRRALRRALGAGGGVRGRLRAWWALPPARLTTSGRPPDAS